MPARKSQKRADADKRIRKAPDELESGEFETVRAAARENNVNHTTLLRRLDGGKTVAESRESQQILTIPEENALAECITRLAIVEYLSKHPFIRELAEEIHLLDRGFKITPPMYPLLISQSAILGLSILYIDILIWGQYTFTE